MLKTDFEISEVDLEENNCDSKNRSNSPDKKAITASVGSYASVLKGREKNRMSGKKAETRLFFICMKIDFDAFILSCRFG